MSTNKNPAASAALPQLIRLRAVSARIGLSRSSIYRLMAAGKFPKPVTIGLRTIAFRSDDLEAWLAGRTAARDASNGV